MTQKVAYEKVPPGFEPGLFGSEPKVMTTTLWNQPIDSCKIVTWRTGLKFRPLRGLGVGNIMVPIRLIQKYMVIEELLLCGLGSLVSE